MLVKAILVGLVGVFGALDATLLGRANFEQPLITCTLVGLVLGDVSVGLQVGVLLEAISLGFVAVGASGQPDMVLGGVIASTLTILTKTQPETAITIAMPIAVLGHMLNTVVQTLFVGLGHKTDDYIEKGEFKNARNFSLIVSACVRALLPFTIIFISIYFGTNAIGSVIDSVPKWLTQGFTVVGKVLPAFGFALLLDMMMDKKNWMFMFAGFFIVAYAKLDITGLALLALIIAFVLADIRFRGQGHSNQNGSSDTDDEEFDELDLPDNE